MGTEGKLRSFTLPSQFGNASGAEGWQSMYRDYTRSQQVDDQRIWFYNAMHYPQPMPAFDTIAAEIPCEALAVSTGIGAADSFAYLPQKQRSHLIDRGVNELLSLRKGHS